MAIVLASASPRRRELLAQIGCGFTVVTSDIIEDNTQDIPPEQLVILQAKIKAQSVAAVVDRHDIVIGADTIVVLDGQVYGKPKDTHDAKCMLFSLSGREHKVITGIAVVTRDILLTDYEVTTVKMAELTAEDIQRYVISGEPMDKAGAYAIQGKGAVFIERIDGCYSNVVGMPLRKLAKLLAKVGVSVP
ncbi:Septum formation protein Maf [bioreactor metagenome]|uniref:Septum formation protein Maf n=1 Tax=bioreactor metagenome TaxID=1076179 RepID=A0A644T9E5_9ZZZZ|nr:Maf family protein [Negativicutes bacterium]